MTVFVKNEKTSEYFLSSRVWLHWFFTFIFLVDKNGVAEGQFTSMVIEQMSEEETSQVQQLIPFVKINYSKQSE